MSSTVDSLTSWGCFSSSQKRKSKRTNTSLGIFKGEREEKWRDTLVYKNRGEHNMTLYKLEESSIGRTQNDFFLLSRFVLLTFLPCVSLHI